MNKITQSNPTIVKSLASVLTRAPQTLLSLLPDKLVQLLILARLNKPIGIYLLLWPTLWALWLAAGGFPGWHLLVVFVVGTLLTRSAGCIINDIADRHFDGDVKRTRERPLVTGKVSVLEALVFMIALLFVALVLVLTTNLMTVILAASGALTAGIYPLMKRYTYMPQAILGCGFAFGILMAFAATQEALPRIAWLLAIAFVVWTVAYDTAYAMVDRDDDLKLGLKSSAILFADMDRHAIGVLQVLFLIMMIMVGRELALGLTYFAGLACAGGLFTYQQYLIFDRDRQGCLDAFLNNHWAGLVIFIGTVAHYIVQPAV